MHFASMTAARSRRTLLFVLVLVIAGLSSVSTSAATNPTFTSPAATDFNFTQDTLGANDVPGQKDLTGQSTILDNNGLFVSWKWDDTSFSGGNTGDACALLDSDDADENVNAVICATIGGKPASYISTRGFTCGNGKTDRCTSTNTAVSLASSQCKLVNPSAAVFGTGDDAQMICKIVTSDFSLSGPALLNTCSYPSSQPTSDPSDCVLIPGVRATGAVIVTKTGGDANCTGAGTPTADCVAAGSRRLNGAEFHVGTDTGTTYTTSGTGTSAGTVCISGLNTGSSYDITEDTPPAGYRIEDLSTDLGVQSTKSVTITSPGTCTTGTQEAKTFDDDPVSAVQVKLLPPATGVTRSQIVCTDSAGGVVDATSEGGTADNTTTANRDDVDETFANLTAGKYTCTIDIAP